MTTNEDKRNLLIRSLKPLESHAGKPTPPPANAVMGGTTGGPNNYGRGRAESLFPMPDTRNWPGPPEGTSQQVQRTGSLPRRRA